MHCFDNPPVVRPHINDLPHPHFTMRDWLARFMLRAVPGSGHGTNVPAIVQTHMPPSSLRFPESDDLLTTRQVAARLQVSTSYVRRLCRTGKVPAIKAGGWRVPAVALGTVLAAVSGHLRRAALHNAAQHHRDTPGRGVGGEARAPGSRSVAYMKTKDKLVTESLVGGVVGAGELPPVGRDSATGVELLSVEVV